MGNDLPKYKRVQTYFDECDHAAFAEEMKKVGITNQSKFVRFLFKCFQQNLIIQDGIFLAREVHDLRIELSKVGGNLNQLARSFNQVGYVNKEQLEKTHHGLRMRFEDVAIICKRIEDEIREEFTPW